MSNAILLLAILLWWISRVEKFSFRMKACSRTYEFRFQSRSGSARDNGSSAKRDEARSSMKKVEKNQEALERIAEVYAKALIQFSIAQAAVYAFTIRKFAEEQEALAAPACSPMPEPIEAQHVDPPTEESPYNILDTVVPDL